MPDSPSTSLNARIALEEPLKMIEVRTFAMFTGLRDVRRPNAARATGSSTSGAPGSSARVGSEPIL